MVSWVLKTVVYITLDNTPPAALIVHLSSTITPQMVYEIPKQLIMIYHTGGSIG